MLELQQQQSGAAEIEYNHCDSAGHFSAGRHHSGAGCLPERNGTALLIANQSV